MKTLVVDVELPGGSAYPVLVGRGAVAGLDGLIGERVKRAAVVTQRGIPADIDISVPYEVFELPAGEAAKRLSVVEELASGFSRYGLTRADCVIGVGGGVVTDVAGFAASVYHRGVDALYVSTTLLGMIDAAIGGKTGVNLPEGKNLVGTFAQPKGVVCDIDHLDTLPEPEYRAGLGELAKYHFLGGGNLDDLDIVERVAACVQIKADVVADDERESGRRAVLNYGHTLAHALEADAGYGLRHGEAVAVGLGYAAEVAHRLGRIDQARVDEHDRVVSTYGLESRIGDGPDSAQLVERFRSDKKSLDGITMVLDGPNGVEPVVIDDVGLLIDAVEARR